MFRRETRTPILDKVRVTESKTLVEDIAVDTKTDIIKYDMDAVRQAVVNWVYINYGDKCDNFYYGSNLVTLIGLLPEQIYESIGSIDLFWDRMERQIEIVRVAREKSYINVLNDRIIFHCAIIDNITKNVFVIEEVIG